MQDIHQALCLQFKKYISRIQQIQPISFKFAMPGQMKNETEFGDTGVQN